jgi:hypothetical protein
VSGPSVTPGESPHEEHLSRKKFPPVGRCIYCDGDGGADGLRSEHIIPFSLGGNAEILEASCIECAKITSRLEQHLARDIFWELRIHTNTQTRRKKERPKLLARHVTINESSKTLMLPIEDHPSFLALPIWGLPGILRGLPPSEIFPEVKAHFYYHVPQNIRTTLELRDGEPAEIHVPDLSIDTPVFARAIAKIAYCQMVAVRGLNGFERHPLPALILGKYLPVSHLVGGDLTTPPKPHERQFVHSIGFATWTPLKGQPFTIATIRLFSNCGTADIGTPLYRVVMAAPTTGENKPL